MKYAAEANLLLLLALTTANVSGQAVGPEQTDYITVGHEAFEASDYEAAIAAYEQIDGIDLQPEVYLRLGSSFHLLDRLVEAEGVYRQVRDLDENLAAAHNNLGAIYYARHDFGEAEDRFEDALEQDPDNVLLQDNLRAAKHARRNNRSVSAVINAEHTENLLLVEGRDGDLIRVVLLLPADVIEDLRFEEIRGDSLMARKFFQEAIEVYGAALEIDRDNARLINKFGIAFHQNEDVRNAERQYRRALDANEHFLPALNNLGSIEMSRERYDAARRYFSRALMINPDSPTVLQNLGYCFFALERYEDGLTFFIAALRLDPNLFENSGGGFGTMVRQPQDSQFMVSFYLAKVFANVGDGDRAISLLYRAYEEGFTRSDMLEDSVFDFISGDERFVQLTSLLSN